MQRIPKGIELRADPVEIEYYQAVRPAETLDPSLQHAEVLRDGEEQLLGQATHSDMMLTSVESG
jgi:hypothetical protein